MRYAPFSAEKGNMQGQNWYLKRLKDTHIRTDPFYLRMVICTAVEYLFRGIEPGRGVNFRLTRGNHGEVRLFLNTGTKGQKMKLGGGLRHEVEYHQEIAAHLRSRLS